MRGRLIYLMVAGAILLIGAVLIPAAQAGGWLSILLSVMGVIGMLSLGIWIVSGVEPKSKSAGPVPPTKAPPRQRPPPPERPAGYQGGQPMNMPDDWRQR